MPKLALKLVFYAGILNFAAFFVGALMLGGDAINGRVVDGHFFLASHGRLTQVSQGVFTYSLWHARSLFVTHPLAMLAGLLWKRA